MASGSTDVQAVLEGAEQVARDDAAPEVGAEHLLLALARAKPGHLGSIFERYKITPDAIAAAFPKPKGEAEGNGGGKPAPTNGPLPPAPEIAAAVSRAGSAACGLGRPSFDAADLLLSLLQDRAARTTEVLAKRFELSQEKLVQDLRTLRGQDRAIAKAEGGEGGCSHHAGAPGSAEAAGVDEAAAGGVGLAAEVRDLEGRFRALCENYKSTRDTLDALRSVVKVLWFAMFMAIAGVVGVGLAYYYSWRP